MKIELLDSFEGKHNVRHIINDNGIESWLTQEKSFGDEAYAKGACKLNTVENETKHVLFLFNSNDEEVGRYYIGKILQGKTPNEIIELIDKMIVFEVWKPSTKCWIPCIDIYYEEKNNPKDIKSVKQEPSISSMGEGEKNNENRFDYTEEMFRNEQKQRDADEEEKKILKYGTTNQDLINKIEKDKKDNRSFWIFIIIIVLVMNIIMGGIAKCTGSKYDPFEDYDTEWQYKHPDKHY